MRVVIRIVICLLLGGISNGKAWGESYLCVMDAMTGFSMDKGTKQWQVANFHTDKKFILSRSKRANTSWEVKEVGNSRPDGLCKEDFNEAGNLFCKGFAEYRFNKEQLRFLYIFTIGYWNDDNKSELLKEGMNTPALGIGKCSPL